MRVKKSRPFLKNQNVCSAVRLHGASSDADRGGQEVPTLFEESVRQSVCMSSDRGRQEVPTLLEESACVQHSQLAGVPLQPKTVRVMKSEPFLKNRLDSQFAGLQARVQHSRFANVYLQRHEELIRLVRLQTVGVRKSRPFLKNLQVHFEESVCMSSARGGQEVPTLFEESECVQHSQPACVHLQIQTVGVRKSRPFLKNQ